MSVVDDFYTIDSMSMSSHAHVGIAAGAPGDFTGDMMTSDVQGAYVAHTRGGSGVGCVQVHLAIQRLREEIHSTLVVGNKFASHICVSEADFILFLAEI